MLTSQQRLAGLSPELVRQAAAVAQALQHGRVADAERLVMRALVQRPAHAELLRLFGLVQQQRGRHREAIRTLSRAAELRPGDALIYNSLAFGFHTIHDSGREREALRRACELAEDWAPCWFNYGWRLFADGDIDDAVPVLRHAVELDPRDPQPRTLLADVLQANGDTSAAIEQYRQIIADNPTRAAQAWWSLATLRPLPLHTGDVQVMQDILRGAEISDSDRVALGCALALALEGQAQYAAAFEQLRIAHALARRAEPCDAAKFRRLVDDVLQAFPAPLADANSEPGSGLIFIVGMPRSGTTLTEQILSAHSQVAGGGELPDLPQIITDESNRRREPFPRWVQSCSPAQWRKLGRRYLDLTERHRDGRAWLTDKMPGNWLYGGAILAMLPRARLVVCRRDRLETCLGCYRYMYRRHPYTHDLADLGQRWLDFDRAAAHWKKLYPGRVHDFVYEELLAEPEAAIRGLLAFGGLPFEQACVDFHQSGRRVNTPSAAQVREPLRRDTARAQKYGALLDPLRRALGMPPFDAP